jgi:predicted transcriptional regulator
MEKEGMASGVDRELVAEIVSSYVAHHNIGVDQLSDLIAEVGRSLGQLGQSEPSQVAARAPAVSVKRSVHDTYVVCLDCGFRAQMLRRHLRLKHGLEPAAYRERWKLSSDHPLTAPSYSQRRSTMAKTIGLGNRPRQPAPAPAPSTKRRAPRARSSAAA